MSLIRNVVGRFYTAMTRWGLQGGPIRRALYYRFFDLNFIREQNATGAGIAEYSKNVGTGTELYLLRRNIHRLEKALTMRPLRNSFALGYVEETVRAYIAVVNGGTSNGWNESEEYLWATTVLMKYFEATKSANNPLLRRLHAEFQVTQPNPSHETFSHGPTPPSDSPVPVAYDQLLSLATRRRSVRWYTDQPVDRALVDNAVRVAQESPTACNRQPYRFVVFDDRESIDKVAKIPMGTAGFGHQLPGLIVVVGDMSAFGNARDRHLIYIDGSLATMGLVYGLEVQGISSCTINWPDMRSRELAMKKLLKLKDHERIVMLVAYGYADTEGLAPFSSKKTLETAREYRTLQPST